MTAKVYSFTLNAQGGTSAIDLVDMPAAGVSDYSQLTGTPTLGTAAATAITAYATAAQGTLAASALQSIAAGSITLTMQANMATSSIVYRKTAGAGAPEVNTVATLKTDLALAKADVGLGSVDNTSDAGKPVSTAQQTALDLKANLISPSFTTPTLGTPVSGNLATCTGLPVAGGGTGVATLAIGGILTGNTANAIQVLAPGATTTILVGGGASTAPVWTAASGTGAPIRQGTPTLTTPVIGAATGTSVILTGAITSSGATQGVGYATGAGGAVTQLTDKSTATPAINKMCGKVTMNAASLAADTSVAHTLTNSSIAANDNAIITHSSGGTMGAYNFSFTPAAGSAVINCRNITPGALAEAVVYRFTIIKGVVA